MLGSVFALVSSKIAADTVYLVFRTSSSFFVWMAIAWAELNFRKQFLKDGHQLSELKYKTPWYPVVSYFAFIASLLSCVLIWFDPTQRVALYYTIPFVLVCYLGHRFGLRRKDNEVVKEQNSSGKIFLANVRGVRNAKYNYQ